LEFEIRTEINNWLRRLQHIWEDKFKVDIRDVGCEVVNWIELAEDRI
jgi:hypothetical protein